GLRVLRPRLCEPSGEVEGERAIVAGAGGEIPGTAVGLALRVRGLCKAELQVSNPVRRPSRRPGVAMIGGLVLERPDGLFGVVVAEGVELRRDRPHGDLLG